MLRFRLLLTFKLFHADPARRNVSRARRIVAAGPHGYNGRDTRRANREAARHARSANRGARPHVRGTLRSARSTERSCSRANNAAAFRRRSANTTRSERTMRFLSSVRSSLLERTIVVANPGAAHTLRSCATRVNTPRASSDAHAARVAAYDVSR